MLRPPSRAGLVVGVTFAMLAMTPSLLPRDWMFQGLVSGLSGAAGYGIGAFAGWALGHSRRWTTVLARATGRVPERLRPFGRPALAVTAVGASLTMLALGARWQRELTEVMGMPATTTSGWLRAAPLLIAVALAVVALARAVRALSLLIARVLRRRLRFPRTLAAVVGAAVVALGVTVLVNDVLLGRALFVTDQAFSTLNTQDHPGVEQPTDPHRSGAPTSLASWDTLGREGRLFVSAGPRTADLAKAPVGAVAAPIRVYVGLETAGDATERARLAVAELDRTDAFERSVLLLATTTGSGWVNAAAADSLEMIHGGDTAVVATQYSYLPSWLSFVLDRARAEQEARALVTAVEARLATIPERDRPRLLLYGESQGAYGSESVFDSLADIRARTDGVLWAGPPHASGLRSSLGDRRDPGTSEALPVYADGLVVRFASRPQHMTSPPTPWAEPRVLYLQHPSDPVVWWAPELLVARPDWLAEPPGTPDRPPMTWFPVVTFWQLGFDLLVAKSVPDGHGHNYDGLVLDGWAAVAPPDGWSAEDTEQVRTVLGPPGG